MWDGFNKRRFPRINLQCEINIQSESGSGSAITATTENIGMGGVCVILDTPLERFAPCRVRLELDEKLPKLESLGKVMWIVPMQSPKTREKQFDTGIEFTDLDSSAQLVLRKYLDEKTKKTAR